MDSVNKTLYIPLYGKAYVSRRGLFLEDKTAERIWDAEGFPLKGKAASKWLAYYMGIRAAVFDDWTKKQLFREQDAVVIHIGCGMDSRALRIGLESHEWYDVDFPEVIAERKRYYREAENYHMIAGDVRDDNWLDAIPQAKCAIVIMEGVSMYLTPVELNGFLTALSERFGQIRLLMDCYTTLAAKASAYKNPINTVGVTRVYGTDDPALLQQGGIVFAREHPMIPESYIEELHGTEKYIFRKLYAGNFAKKLYRLYEFQKG